MKQDLLRVAGKDVIRLFGIPILTRDIYVLLDADIYYSRVSWNRLRSTVRRRDQATCQYCSKKAPRGSVDHKVPLAQGGSDDLDNLVWACRDCNSSKGNRTIEQWRGQD